MAAENPEVVRLWWAGFNEHGTPPLDLCDERIEIGILADFPVQGPYRGHEGVRLYAQQMFEVIDEPRVELEEIIDAEDGETIVTVQRALGRARHTRLKVDFPWAAVWTVRDGKVVRAQGYRSKAEALEAVGLGQ